MRPKKSRNSTIAISLACLALTLMTYSAKSNVLVDSDGFESPKFMTGDVDGQNSWAGVGNGVGEAQIQTSEVLTGLQALEVTKGANSNDYWYQPITTPMSGRFVSIDWDMKVMLTSTTAGFGPFFGVNAIDDSSIIALVAGFGVDASTGDILYQQGGTGFLVESTLDYTFNTWAHFRIELDFQTDTYNAFYNGTLAATSSFVDDGLAEIDNISDADIVALAAGGDAISQALLGTAYFDNFIVRDGLRGDYNSDGIVDAADYTVWRDQEGQTGFALVPDGNADGIVDELDYDLWVEEYGMSNSIVSPASTVPEPSTLMIAGIISLMAGSCSRSISR